MGGDPWKSTAYKSMVDDYSTKKTDDIFVSKKIDVKLDPVGVDIREARDSDVHPNSLAIMVMLDETGSMGAIPEVLIREKLGALMETLIDNGVEDASVMFGGIGDHKYDRSPLQVGQFESGVEQLDESLTGIFLEGLGGGTSQESYLLAWLFAARHTSIDCWEKRQLKGFLFTVGDEASWDVVSAEHLKKIMGYPQSEDVTDKQLLEEAEKMYHVYHIHINEAAHRDDNFVFDYWKDLLGQRFVVLEDYRVLAETIASIVAVQTGADLKDVSKAFSDSTALTVTKALSSLPVGVSDRAIDKTSGVTKL